MNKTAITIGILSLMVTAALVYKQVQQESNEQAVLEQSGSSTLSLEAVNENSDITPSPIELAEPVIIQSSGAQAVKVTSLTSKTNTANSAASSHDEPADHRGAAEPKHHGHEHAEPRRRPEDNSIIPPGEPKKPLPESKGNN